MTKMVHTDEELARLREIAGKPAWDEWIAANGDTFDAQGVLDAIWELADEAEMQQSTNDQRPGVWLGRPRLAFASEHEEGCRT